MRKILLLKSYSLSWFTFKNWGLEIIFVLMTLGKSLATALACTLLLYTIDLIYSYAILTFKNITGSYPFGLPNFKWMTPDYIRTKRSIDIIFIILKRYIVHAVYAIITKCVVSYRFKSLLGIGGRCNFPVIRKSSISWCWQKRYVVSNARNAALVS